MKQQRGSSILEALIALLILSVSVLGLIALQANLLRIGSQSRYRLEASLLGRNIAGMIAVDAANVGCYALVSTSAIPCNSTTATAQATAWRKDVMALLPGAGEPTIAVTADRIATVTISWKPPKDPATRNLVIIVQPPT